MEQTTPAATTTPPPATPRELALGIMQSEVIPDSDRRQFMAQAGVTLPSVLVDGALPAMTLEPFGAKKLMMTMDVLIRFTVGDFWPLGPTGTCSTYFDRTSPWYNVFYGAYAMRSYKPDGTAWGFSDRHDTPDFEEIFRLATVDYNFLMAAQLGCPPECMSFQILHCKTDDKARDGWYRADVEAIIPSGLHRPTQRRLDAYALYGRPNAEMVARMDAEGTPDFEPVRMRGSFHLRRIRPDLTDAPPLSLAFGALCPCTDGGQALLDQILTPLREQYLPVGVEVPRLPIGRPAPPRRHGKPHGARRSAPSRS